MEIYIVAKVIDNNGKDCGYLLHDLDEENEAKSVLRVTKEQLISALKAKKMKLYNARLVGKYISGTYYSLNNLPYIKARTVYDNDVQIVLKNIDDMKYILARVTFTGTVVRTVVTADRLNQLLQFGKVCNYEDGEIKCYRPVTHPYVKPERDLDKEVYDKDTVWTVDDFRCYMNKHNYKYTLDQSIYSTDNYYLSNIDTNCKAIKVPKGVTQISYLYGGKIDSIESLIFSETVYCIERLYKNRRDQNTEILQNDTIVIDNLIFQGAQTPIKARFTANAICNVIVRNTFIAPNYTKIVNSFNSCYFNTLDLSYRNYEEIEDSFCYLKLQNPIVKVKAEELTKCLNDIKNISSLYIDASIIKRSARNLCCTTIKLSDRTTEIRYSLSHLDNIIFIDISNCTQLESISNSFNYCKLLNTLKLPSNIRSIYSDFLVDTQIKDFEIPESVKRFTCTTDLKHIVYPKNVDSLLYGVNMPNINSAAKLEFKSVLRHIEGAVFCCVSTLDISDVTLQTFGIDLSEAQLGNEIFSYTSLSFFDSIDIPKNNNIGDKCFDNCQSLKTAVFNKNIKTLGNFIFNECNNIKTIAISDEVSKITASTFKGIKQNNVTVCVVNNSYAHKYLSKIKHSLAIRVFDNFEDILSNIYNSSILGNKVNKYKLLLNSRQEFKSLLDPKYINNINITYGIVSQYIQDKPNNPVNLNLDTSKFVNIPLANFDKIGKGIKDYYSKYSTARQIEYSKDNRFISLCNLFTTLGKPMEELYGYEELNKLDILNIYSIYSGVGYGIYYIRLDFIKNISKESKKVFIAVITIGDYVKFICPYMHIFIDRFTIGDGNALLNLTTSDKNYSVTKDMVPGDYIRNYDLVINSASMPRNEYGNKFLNSVNNNYIILEILWDKRKSRPNFEDSVYYKTLVIDLYTSNLVEIEATYYTNDGDAVGNYTSVKVKQIHSLDKIHKLISKTYTDVLNAFDNTLNRIILKEATLTFKKAENLLSEENFHIEPIKHHVDYTKALYKSGITNIEELPLSAVKELFNSVFFVKTEATLDKLRKLNISPKIYTIKNTDSIVVEYKVNTSITTVYVSGVINPNTPMKSKGLFFESYFTLGAIINILASIGKEISNTDRIQYSYLDNEMINTDDYVFTHQHTRPLHNGFKLNIAVERFSGYSFIISEYFDMDFYKLFRFKTLIDAINMLNTLFDDSNLRYQTERLCRELHNGYSGSNINSLFKLRNDIISGLPENYPYANECYNLFNLLAKQPKNIN